MRVLVSGLVCILAISGWAFGQAPAEIAQSRLDSGGQARFIVWFDTPSVAFDAESGAANEVMADWIADQRTAAFENIFASSIQQLRQPEDGGPRILREMRYSPMATVLVNQQQLELLQADPRVRRVEVDHFDRAYASWGAIGASSTAAKGFIGVGQTVAIVDTGVAGNHPAFGGRFVGSACFSSNVPGQSISFCPLLAPQNTTGPTAGYNCPVGVGGVVGCDHGSAVAGVAVGMPNLGIEHGNAGIAAGASIVAVQVFSNFEAEFCPTSQRCAFSYVSDQVAALEWLYQERERLNLSVVNMSLGSGQHPGFCPDDPRAQIIGLLHAADVSVVAAVGNDGFGAAVGAPACIRDVIAVSAYDERGQHETYSNFGIQVDISAPGFAGTANAAGGERTAEGTSIAAPYISGAIAMLRQFMPELETDGLIAALRSTRSVDLTYNELVRRQTSNLTVSPLAGFEIDAGLVLPSGTEIGPIVITNTGDVATDVTLQVYSDTSGWLEIETQGGQRVHLLTETIEPGETREFPVHAFPPREPDALAGNYVTVMTNGSSIAQINVLQLFQVPDNVAGNDNFASAAELTGSTNTLLSSFNGATREDDEPSHTWLEDVNSLWWRWTAPFDQRSFVGVSRPGYGAGRFRGGYPAAIAIYRGDSLDDLERLGSSSRSDSTASVVFDAIAGETYYFAASGAETGPLQYTITHRLDGAPLNDPINDAFLLEGQAGEVRGTTNNATIDTGQRHRNIDELTVWYQWRPSVSTDMTFALQSSSSTQRVEIYALDQFGELSLVGQTDPDLQPGSGVVNFTAQEGVTYYIKVAADRYYTSDFRLRWTTEMIDEGLRSAILPGRRSVSIGGLATAFLTVINPSSRGQAETGCVLEPPFGFSGEFSYQETDPATNSVVGEANTPFDLAIAEVRSFVFALRPSVGLDDSAAAPTVACPGSRTAVINGVNSFELTSFNWPLADIIASAVSPTADGVIRIEQGRATAVALAAVNIGRPQTLTLSAVSLNGDVASEFSVEFCSTDPDTGACVGDRSETLTFDFASNEVRTFTAFIRSTGGPVAFAPRTNRVGFEFERFSRGGIATSLALTVE